jgi:hypothetical protein
MESNNTLFSESQRFRQWWVWALLIGVEGLMIYGLNQQIFLKKPFGTNPTNDSGIIIGVASITLVLIAFWFIRLNTSIDNQGIHVQFFPFHLKNKSYVWKDIQSLEVRRYRPLLEFGGWGIRGIGKNRALNISGNVGLQIYFKNGKKLLIGTQKGDELRMLIETLKHNFKIP